MPTTFSGFFDDSIAFPDARKQAPIRRKLQVRDDEAQRGSSSPLCRSISAITRRGAVPATGLAQEVVMGKNTSQNMAALCQIRVRLALICALGTAKPYRS